MRTASLAAAGIVVLLMGCRHPNREERATVQRWLLCEECREGERAAVVTLGDNVVGALGDALTGPPDPGRQNIRLQAKAMFARIPDTLVQQPAYVEHFVSNYVATYQSRAAIALALIGTTRARETLLRAVRDERIPDREDVRSVIGASARVSLTAVDSTTQSAPIDSFVRITPTVLVVRDTSNSGPPKLEPLAGVRIEFRVEAGGGRVSNPAQRTDANGRATVRWQLGPGVDSVNVLRAETVAGVVRFRAIGRGLAPHLAFIVQPPNVRVGDTLTTTVQVAVFDAWGRRDSVLSGSVEMFVVGSGSTWIAPLVAGAATFPGLRFGISGSGQRLLARVAGATQAVSAPFDVLP